MNDAMATSNNKIKISVRLADVKEISLNINASEKPVYDEAEKLVNKLWNNWMERFKSTYTSYEVMAMVAFQFARFYSQSFNDNAQVHAQLTEFEQRLNSLVTLSSDDDNNDKPAGK